MLIWRGGGGCVEIENRSVVDLGPGPRGNDLGDIRVAQKFRADTARTIISRPIVTQWENLFSLLIKDVCHCYSSWKSAEFGQKYSLLFWLVVFVRPCYISVSSSLSELMITLNFTAWVCSHNKVSLSLEEQLSARHQMISSILKQVNGSSCCWLCTSKTHSPGR